MSSPFKILNDGQTVFDNTNRLSRIARRRNFYLRLVLSTRSHVRWVDLLRSHFALFLPDMQRPVYLTVEFTNICNLKCPYCTSPLHRRPQGMMTEEVFSALVRQVRDFGIDRVSIVGNGEATLHPRFNDMVRRLAPACRYLTLVTNGQRMDLEKITSMLEAPLRLIEIGRSGEVLSDALFVHSTPERYPRCTLPLKAMGVMWNGKVPLCDFSEKQTGNPEGLLLGNITENTLQSLWNHKIMNEYRRGHRDRDVARIPICRGCVGG